MERYHTKTNSRWSTSIASPPGFMFHKTRNLKDSRRSPASDRFTSRTTFRIGFEKCCHSPSGFCGPVGFIEYALEYFEMSCVVVEIVERDMDAAHNFHVSQSHPVSQSVGSGYAGAYRHSWTCQTDEHTCVWFYYTPFSTNARGVDEHTCPNI